MKTNILVQYQGGGYSGCIWEWNFFYIDENGAFHDIVSSGCAGIGNKQDAEQLLEQDASSTYIYGLNNEQDIKTFSSENHAWNVQQVCQWFENYNSPEAEFFAVCSECGCKVDSDDLVMENEILRCCECHSIGTCSCCDDYVGDTEIVGVDPDEHYGHEYLCTDCKEYHDSEREAADLEDLRWQSFCTGSPDMFDLESAEPEIDSCMEYPGQLILDFQAV